MKKHIALAGSALMLPAALLPITTSIASADVVKTNDRSAVVITANAASSTAKHTHAGKHAKKAHATRHTKHSKDDILGGVVKSIAGNSLTIATHSQTETVQVNAATRIINRMGQPIALSVIHAGNRIAVLGEVSSGAFQARIIRDVSVPVTGATTK